MGVITSTANAGATYVPIANYTVTGSNLIGTTGVTFSSIPSTYTDLVLVYAGQLTAAAISLLQINGDTSAAYSSTILGGNGSSAASTRQSSANTQWLSAYGHQNANQGNIIMNFQSYGNSSINRTNLFRANNGGGLGLDAGVGLWRNTSSAINSIKVYLDRAEYYVVGSTFTLYGIKSA